MRVLIFSTAYFPLVGGAEVAIKEITDRLPEIEFDLICAKLRPELADEEKMGNVTVYRVGRGSALLDKLFVPFRGAALARRLHRARRYDYFWGMMATYASGAAYIHNILHPRSAVPIILTLQEGDSEAHLTYRWGGLLNVSWRLALKRTHTLTAISTYLLKRAQRLGFRGRSELIPNGVDVKKFTISNLEFSKHDVGFDEGDTILITTSRLNVKNAIADVIDALAYLPEQVKFLVIGAGELEGKLKDRVRRLHLEHRVRFLGLVSHDEIPKYLRISDIFIRPSLSEGFGNSFIEAMAAGLPVIATPVGGIPDFLKDGETGLFVDVHDPKSIAEKVGLLISDAALRQKLIEEGRRMAIEKYDWNLIAREMKSKVFLI